MRIWTVSERKAGTLTQCLGVARYIDPDPNKVVIEKKLPRWRRGLLSPYRKLAQPEPDIIISCGYMAPRHVVAIAEACRVRPLTVHLQTPHKFAKFYDMAFISRHNWSEEKSRQPTFHQMLGVPHQFTQARIDDIRPPARARWATGGRPVIAVLVGGPNGAYRFEDETLGDLVDSVCALAAAGWTVLVSTSRRSHPSMLTRLLELQVDHVFVWDRNGENPYAEFIAAADAFLITKDTITMTCEALTTGKPVYIFDLPKTPSKKLDEFEWFHNDLANTLKLTRPFHGVVETYPYSPPDEARRIAGAIVETLSKTGRLPADFPAAGLLGS
jgi:mitochondrial fission protein ELM1